MWPARWPGWAVLAGLLLTLAILAGCTRPGSSGSPQDRVAAAAVEGQICRAVSDSTVDASELRTLGGLLNQAHTLQLPDAILDPLHQMVADGRPTRAEIAALRRACARS